MHGVDPQHHASDAERVKDRVAVPPVILHGGRWIRPVRRQDLDLVWVALLVLIQAAHLVDKLIGVLYIMERVREEALQ